MAFELDGIGTNGAPTAGSAPLERSLVHARATRQQWRDWARAEGCLAGLNDDRLRHELAGRDQHRTDVLLAALVRLARTGPHPDAALLVLARCLLPGMRHRLTRLAPGLDRNEAFSTMFGALAERVRDHPAAERTTFVAAFLLEAPTRRLRRARDVERTWASYSRTVPHRPTTATGDRADLTGLPTDTILGLAVAAGVLTAPDGWLIHATRADGLDLRAAAHCLGLTYRAAVKRRQRAERRWAAWWDPDHRQGGRRRP